jgi:hypothetical protein
MYLGNDDTYWSLFTDLSFRRTGFTTRPVPMGFVVDKAALEQIFSKYFAFLCNIHSTIVL